LDVASQNTIKESKHDVPPTPPKESRKNSIAQARRSSYLSQRLSSLKGNEASLNDVAIVNR